MLWEYCQHFDSVTFVPQKKSQLGILSQGCIGFLLVVDKGLYRTRGGWGLVDEIKMPMQEPQSYRSKRGRGALF